ncbi:MAG TPA: hypothetical protein VM282_12960 [Acidimicrobiales bacterium]|nr:hypothetical protein [Acidimicrobiales bacterium]
MTAPRKLTLYAVILAAVLGVSIAIGSAANPIGLSNVEPAKAHGGQMDDEMVPGLATADADYRLVADTDVLTADASAPYRFRIVGTDGVVTEFDVAHTKTMHLIVVRRDFVGFQHLHPDMDAAGTWQANLTLSQAGAYRVFADFVIDGQKRTLGTDLFVGGSFEPQPMPGTDHIADAGDGYTVELPGHPHAGEETTLTFVIRHHGVVVDDIADYLGARGHLVALRDGDLAYLHVHADEEQLLFETAFPTPGAYRLFLQFSHTGQVRTAAFTIDTEETSR